MNRLYFLASLPILIISSLLNTFPIGLLGEFSNNAFDFGVIDFSILSILTEKSLFKLTKIGFALMFLI